MSTISSINRFDLLSEKEIIPVEQIQAKTAATQHKVPTTKVEGATVFNKTIKPASTVIKAPLNPTTSQRLPKAQYSTEKQLAFTKYESKE